MRGWCKAGGQLVDCVVYEATWAMTLCKAEIEVELVIAFVLDVGKGSIAWFPSLASPWELSVFF